MVIMLARESQSQLPRHHKIKQFQLCSRSLISLLFSSIPDLYMSISYGLGDLKSALIRLMSLIQESSLMGWWRECGY